MPVSGVVAVTSVLTLGPVPVPVPGAAIVPVVIGAAVVGRGGGVPEN